MKTRTGYVSNSSSSSFVVVPDEAVAEYRKNMEEHVIDGYNSLKLLFDFSEKWAFDGDWSGLFDEGETAFGWQFVKYHDTKSKWNWLVLQAYYGGDPYIGKMDEYLASYGIDLKIDWSEIERRIDDIDAYIDHQSVDASTTFQTVEEVGIDEFLANPKCYVCNGNDNSDPDDEEYEERW